MKTDFATAVARSTFVALLVTAFAAALLAAGAAGASDAPGASPLAHFEAFIGGWGPAPGSEILEQRPEMADDLAFLFAWAGEERKILRFYEGVEDGDLGRRILECMAAADPRSGEIVFVGYQVRGDFLYRGTFEPIENGFRRLYEVTYPPGTELPEENRERGAIDYRDTCRLVAPDRLHCTTEQRRGADWKAWGSAEGYTLVRVAGAGRAAASPPNAGGLIKPLPPPPEMERLGFLVGTWHNSAELLDREGKVVGTFDSAELPGGGEMEIAPAVSGWVLEGGAGTAYARAWYTYQPLAGVYQAAMVDMMGNFDVLRGPFADGRLTLTEVAPKPHRDGGTIMWRRTYYDIEDDAHRISLEHSRDGGETWTLASRQRNVRVR